MEKIAEYEIPVRCLSRANQRGHWAKHDKSRKQQRGLAEIQTRNALRDVEAEFPICFRLIRYGPQDLDSDNLSASMKAVRDGICDAIGIDDKSDKLRWRHHQEKGSYRVVVEVYESADQPRLVVE